MKTFAKMPDQWRIVPIKAVAEYSVSNVDKHSLENENPVRLCNYTDVYKNEQIKLDMDLMKATATLDEITKFHLEVDDVVITKDSESWNDIAIPAYIAETSDDLVCGYHLAMIRPRKNLLDGRFLFRCLQSRSVALQLELASTGVTRYGLPKGAIGSALIPLPAISIQKQIADYLDRETTEIDNLIAEKEKMLALLEEKREALISRAVTRGLDANVSFKRSGIEWLGDVPKHWTIERAKNLFAIRDERSETGDEELLSVSHITGVTSRADKQVYMFKADDMTGYKRCEKGDFVTNTLWGWMGAMGVSPLDGIVSPDYHVYIFKGDLLPEFMELLCRSKPFIAEVVRWSKGVWSSRLRIYPENFFEIRFPIPPKAEQLEIIAKVSEEDAKNKELKKALTDSISLLKERRSALITAAVTGQISIEEMTT